MESFSFSKNALSKGPFLQKCKLKASDIDVWELKWSVLMHWSQRKKKLVLMDSFEEEKSLEHQQGTKKVNPLNHFSSLKKNHPTQIWYAISNKIKY